MAKELTLTVKASELPAVKEYIAGLVAERDTLAAQLAAARAALEHIAEYWNRSENDTAMNDALYHMIDTAEVALSATPPPIVAELARLRKVAEAASIIQGYEDFESNFGKLGKDLGTALVEWEASDD